jgi:hypothetical protein
MLFNISEGGKMKVLFKAAKSVLLISMILCPAVHLFAEGETEITGFYQQYRNFDYKIGISELDFPPTQLKGGGFSIAQNLAPWFALWTQFSFYGSAEHAGTSVRIINNQQGIRYQTRNYGPFRLYVKGGLGFSRFSLDISGLGSGGETKFSLAYGGGVHVWMNEHFGIVADLSHVHMGLPQLVDSPSREKWDSGLAYTTGLTVRF